MPTISISHDLHRELLKRKIWKEDTEEEVIWDILESTMELSKQTKKDIEKSRREIAEGKFVTMEEVKKGLKYKQRSG